LWWSGRKARGQSSDSRRRFEAGLTVKEIASKFKAKPGNLHVWFSSTGRKVKQIKKIAPATYAWVE
jgi:hypothetical protein